MINKKTIIEMVIGISLALLAFLAWKGFDVVPILVMAVLLGLAYYVAETKGLLRSGGGHAVVQSKDLTNITFDDIGGQEGAIKELKEALDFIRNTDKLNKLGIRPLKGILLTGPPGTGKTLMAKAAANYTDAVFVSTSGSEFVEMYAGVGAQRVRKIFQTARETALKQSKSNAIVFIDEIDVVGGKRGQNSGHMEYDQTLNQLLVEMDGLKANDDIRLLLIAATNRVDMLDPALLRPGRFDRIVKVDLPSKDGREQIIKIHTKNKPLEHDVNIKEIAKETFGFSGAHLESLVNEAAIYAFREGAETINQNHFKEAIDKVIMGEKLDKRPKQEELQRVSIHETGHALISELLKPGSVSTLTISPRGNALGYMRQSPEDDTYLYTAENLENEICIMLAGALAEEIALNSRSTGAYNDFEKALSVARKLVKSGLSSLGIVEEENVPQEMMHNALTEIIKKEEEKVLLMLNPYSEWLTKVATLLIEEERLSGDEFRKLIRCHS